MPPSQELVPHATLNTLFEKLGEAVAVAREAKHAANGASQKIDAVAGKVDALALVVATQGQIREHVERLERTIVEQGDDIETLTADKLRREGAIGLVEWVSKNYPVVLLGIALALWVGVANGVLK